MKKIKSKIDKLKAKINLHQAQIYEMQNACPHENFTGVYKANTGNWCPDDDSYWIQADCLDCGKHFHVDQDREPELYRSMSMSGKVTHR